MLLYCSAYYVVSNRFFKKDVNFLPVFFFLISFHTMCAISLSNLTLCPLHWFTIHFLKKRKTRINGQFDHSSMILIWISFLQHARTHSQTPQAGWKLISITVHMFASFTPISGLIRSQISSWLVTAAKFCCWNGNIIWSHEGLYGGANLDCTHNGLVFNVRGFF